MTGDWSRGLCREILLFTPTCRFGAVFIAVIRQQSMVILYDDFRYADSSEEADPDVDIDWGFRSSAEGWSVLMHVQNWSASENCLEGSICGNDPGILSPDHLNLSCDDVSSIRVKMKNNTVSTQASFFFSTTDSTSFSADKQVGAQIIAHDPGYTVYEFDMAGNANWTGILKRLRFDPANNNSVSSGTFSIDYIDLDGLVVVCSEDDFNRADTAYSSDGSLIGPNWVNAYSGDEWKVCESNLCLNAGGVPGILYNASLATQSGFGGSFFLSADVCAEVGWAGLVFNVQDASNYYVLRFKAGTRDYQLLGVQNGTNATVVKWSDASSVFAAGNFYSISVSSSEACEFDFSICDGDSVMASAGVSDSQSLFPAGYAGFYNVVTGSYDPDSRFDLFSLRVVPDEL